MWAAFKSDLKEFASGAANETNAVASKVVGTVNILGEGNATANATGDGSNRSDSGDNGNGAGASSAAAAAVRHDGSVLLVNAAYSIGTKSLQGLSSVSSMVGGIVAPRASSNATDNDDDEHTNKNNYNNNPGGKSYSAVPSSSFSNNSLQTNIPSSAISSMLAEDEDEEEELGWDDDDDDDELNVEEEDDDDANAAMEGKESKKQANSHGPKDPSEAAGDTKKNNAPPPSQHHDVDGSLSPSVDEEVLRALQSKLELVEQCRADLQSEHRRQTAELVELRAKLVEMEQQHQSSSSEGGSAPSKDENTGTNEEIVQALQHEIERLKQIFDEQMKDASEEHKQTVAALIQEKETLEKELHSQRQKNQDIVTEMQTLMEMNNQRESQVPAEISTEEEQALLHQYQTQIQELTLELEALQVNLDNSETALSQVNESNTMQSQRHQEEMEQQLARTTALEDTLSQTKEEYARVMEESKVKLVEMENVVQAIKTELETKELAFEDRLQVEIARVKSSHGELALNTSTASSYVTSDDAPRQDEEEEEEVDEEDINDHVNLAAAVTATANMDDNLAKGSHEEEPRRDKEVIDLIKADTTKGQTGVIDLIKSDTEEELSDDWGDGGWGDDD